MTASDSASVLPDVQGLLPHRYPFLLVDRITAIDPGRRVEGIKRVTGNEWFQIGTGDARLPMPNVLVVEALAQLSAGILIGLVDGAAGAIGYFMGMNRVRFRGAAAPGDEIGLVAELLHFRRGICRTRVVASVDGRRIVTAELTTIVRAA
jgi:3-hydroxyacyl-[acyl-carrier-protein] dehydratase